MKNVALDDIRVLENTVQIAGPYCGRLLAELGAEVIKIEPPNGEASRRSPPFLKGSSLSYLYWNANKRSIALNLKEEQARKIFLELASKSDIVISNYRPGVMERLGLGYDSLRRINKRIISLTITGFGSSGPLSSFAGYDMIAQAMSGLADANACEDGSPKVNSMSLDYSAAMVGVISVLAALYVREKTGEGQSIDISLQDVAMIYAQHLIGQDLCGMKYQSGNRRLAFAPFNVYETKDGYAVVAIDEQDRWGSFLKSIGKNDLLSKESLRSVDERVKNYDEVDSIVSTWAKTQNTTDLVRVVTAAGGASCPVKKIPDVKNDEHLKLRGMLGTMDSDARGIIPYVGSALKLSVTPGRVEALGPDLGEGTQYILKEILRYSEDEVRELRSSGVVR